MIMAPNHLQLTASTLLCLLSLLLGLPVQADRDKINERIISLDEKFRQLSSDLYRSTKENPETGTPVLSDIGQLHDKASKLVKNHQKIEALQLLALNTDTIRDNVDDETVFDLTRILLDNNEWNLASVLLDDVLGLGDEYLVANMQFIFAKYFADRNDWANVIEFTDGIAVNLSADDAAYAHLLNGVALQKLRKHRQSITLLARVPSGSRYYPHAQLNIANANIRQGWWTDAHDTINGLIKHIGRDNNDEFINRLYLTLGYSLLQQEYYRDARNTFRHIGLDSRYTNRALLGIALTATSQGDYTGGLNALSILKGKQTPDLPVAESYLLIPYVYEKLDQDLTATASYNEALVYYQARLHELDGVSARQVKFEDVEYRDRDSSLIIDNIRLDYGNTYPVSFLDNYRTLLALQTAYRSPAVVRDIERLVSSYNDAFQTVVVDLLDRQKKHHNSYLNQTRYGLARLYDKSNKEGN